MKPAQWSDLLDGYSSASLTAMRKRWPGRGPGDKAGKIADLSRLLADEKLVRGQIAQLTPAQGLALKTAVALGERPFLEMRLACAAQGVPSAEAAVKALLERGVLLARRVRNAIDFSNLTADIPVFPHPLAAGRVQAKAPAEDLPAVKEALIRTVHRPDPGRLAQALIDLCDLARRKKLAITRQGALSARHIPTMSQELGLYTEPLTVPFVLEVALQAGLLEGVEGQLRPSPEAEGILARPLPDIIAHAFRAYAKASGWPDDLPPADSRAAYEFVRDPPYGAHHPSQVLAARTVAVGVLGRVTAGGRPGGGWAGLDDFVRLALATEPRLLHVQIDPYGYSFGRYARDGLDAKATAEQWAYLRAFVTRTAFAFGLVELGLLGDELPRFAQPIRGYEHWNQFFNPRFHRTEDKDKPRWAPDPARVAFRLTPLGRAILRGEPLAAPAAAVASGLRVGPDFEILAPLESTPAEVRFQLERFAERLPGHATDPVLRLRLTRPRLIQALRAGLKWEEIRRILEKGSGAPLPPNVARTMGEWAASFGQVRIHLNQDLVELPSAASLREFLKAHPQATAAGDRFALAPRGAATGEAIDYTLPPPRCLAVRADGTLQVQREKADLLIDSEIARFSEAAGADQRRLTADSVKGWSSADILGVLAERGQVPPGLAIALQGWCGEVPALPLGSLTILQVSAAQAAELLSRPEIRACIAGSLAPGVLVVRDARALRAALKALRIDATDRFRL